MLFWNFRKDGAKLEMERKKKRKIKKKWLVVTNCSKFWKTRHTVKGVNILQTPFEKSFLIIFNKYNLQ
jgi:hypothetical protein